LNSYIKNSLLFHDQPPNKIRKRSHHVQNKKDLLLFFWHTYINPFDFVFVVNAVAVAVAIKN
jgi:hypothetical protein